MSFLSKLKARTEQMHAAMEDAFKGEKVPPEIKEERYNICQSCEHLFKPTQNCKKCGCFVVLKTWLPSQECPVGKWKSIQIRSENS